ncbi:uncharacterized protein LOC134772740 [Penaeus indicus]|uniref:uncharacterized protein LOC134772740 n=1 Tax=Penaeus indicus TaxID=29960 RepID=UPI00300C466C
MKTIGAKVVVLGSQGVGKTSLVTRYETKTFSRNTSSTIGASFSNIEIIINDTKVKMQVWDTAGQERFRSMAPMYYRGAHAALLVFDITKLQTYNDIQSWVHELSSRVGEGLMLVLVGNKCDLDQCRVVARDVAQQYAASIGAIFLETSAMDETGIEEMFEIVATEMLRKADEVDPTVHLYSSEAKSTIKLNSSATSLNDSSLPRAKNSCC